MTKKEKMLNGNFNKLKGKVEDFDRNQEKVLQKRPFPKGNNELHLEAD